MNSPSIHRVVSVLNMTCSCDLVPLDDLRSDLLPHVQLSVDLASSNFSMEKSWRPRSRNRYCLVQEFVSGPFDSMHVVSPTYPHICVKVVSVNS